MTTRATVLSLAFLAGCASAAPEPAPEAGAAATGAPAPRPVETSPSAGPSDWALAIVGTPFVFAFRVVTCAATAVIAGPTAGALILTPDPQPGLAYLRDGLAQNCGPPYGVPVPVAAEYEPAPDIGYAPDARSYPEPEVERAPDAGRPRPLTPYSSAAAIP
jgi:hypothetical protein